ncbi:selenocysteine-specific translation elongation factor [Acanthopleuribacter pedis]|uniref:Selenocysteine-specific elongation factor n=1 Tax=Acanthopleuribacter pedis TaxID=442870 RepID=A0A8J7Q7S4_9BACT|nr:selenocysteine-specific translation elongation factor [Acanthopleuribacter pedis]MBO1319951.1 selenocysteine-specific translation elongation factor [Acanthopleuribacter pedis]
MTPTPLLIATAGHVDHGKSALVHSLTGTDPDRWAEEQQRGITIDLGFAARVEGTRLYSFVDVPGHERFVHNMLAGVGCLDAALLVIAADESIMPQTREHALALHFLRVPHVIIVLTKVDLVDEEMLALVHEELDDWLPDFGWEKAPRLGFSKVQPETHQRLRQVLGEVPKRSGRPHGQARFAVDRVFSADGSGTVVTGVMERGVLAVEDELVRDADGEPLRVRRIQMHGAEVDQVSERGRAALNLTRIHYRDAHRGDLLTAAPAPYPSKFLLVRLTDFDPDWAPGIKHRLHLHFLSRRQQARLLWREGSLAMLALEQPAGYWLFDRGLIRDHSPLAIVAGFEVLHPNPAHTKRRAVRDRLATTEIPLLATPTDAITFAAWWRWIAALENAVIEQAHVHRLWGLRVPVEWAADWVVLDARHWVTRDLWQQTKTRFHELLARHHQQHSYRTWLDRETCIAAAKAAGMAPELLPKTISSLEARGILTVAGDRLRLTDFKPGWRPEDRRRLEAFLAAWDPENGTLDLRHLKHARKQTADIEQWLHRIGCLVWLTPDLMIDVAKLHAVKQRMAADHGDTPLTVQTLKASFGFSRKLAIPLLEWMDHAGWTRREDTHRVWLHPSLAPPTRTLAMIRADADL